MSLVNNMLRDLDRRRNDSDSSSGAVRLMPAGDTIIVRSQNYLPFVLVALLLVLISVVYFWSQLGQSNVDQRLDLQPAPALSDSRRVVEDLQESIALAAQREESLQLEDEPDRQDVVQAGVQTEPEMREPRSIPTDQNFLRTNSSNTPDTAPVLASNIVESAAVEPVRSAVSDALPNASVASMKDQPRYSTEQLDTIAVQDALRLIADGDAEAAFTTLERYIIQNRNAHQSRETYAKLLMSRGRAADATALINVGLGLAPNHAGFKKVKARLLMSEGDIPAAVTTLISRAPDIENDAEYHDLLASAQLSSKDFAGAIISYRGLVEHDQTQGKWWYGYAAANDQLGNSSIARQAYLRAMQYSNLSANLRQRSQERVAALNP